MGADWRDAAKYPSCCRKGLGRDNRLDVLQAGRKPCPAVESPNSAPKNHSSLYPSQEPRKLIYAVLCDILYYAITGFSLEADPLGIC